MTKLENDKQRHHTLMYEVGHEADLKPSLSVVLEVVPK